ncbi:MAG: hypothetical protein U1E05_25015, partial [Patescibacteria group bacterium]|nr:hypothetical protein [Patescibacteria group bacterium]
MDFRLHLRSGRMIRAELVLHGLNDRFGVAQTEGNIHVRIPHKDLFPRFTPTERYLDLVASFM